MPARIDTVACARHENIIAHQTRTCVTVAGYAAVPGHPTIVRPAFAHPRRCAKVCPSRILTRRAWWRPRAGRPYIGGNSGRRDTNAHRAGFKFRRANGDARQRRERRAAPRQDLHCRLRRTLDPVPAARRRRSPVGIGHFCNPSAHRPHGGPAAACADDADSGSQPTATSVSTSRGFAAAGSVSRGGLPVTRRVAVPAPPAWHPHWRTSQ